MSNRASHCMRRPRAVVRCCNLGMIVLALSINFAPPLFIPFREAFGLTYEQLGRLALVNFTTQVTFDLLCGALSDRLPPRLFVITANGLAFTGLWLLSFAETLFPASPYSGLLLAACYLLAALAPLPWVSLAACVLGGLGASILWPGVLVLCARRFPLGGGSMFATLSAAGDIGCALLPWVLGGLADRVRASACLMNGLRGLGIALTPDQAGLRAAFLGATLAPLLLLLLITRLRRACPATRTSRQNLDTKGAFMPALYAILGLSAHPDHIPGPIQFPPTNPEAPSRRTRKASRGRARTDRRAHGKSRSPSSAPTAA